jgi:uncharacterized protein (TIGR03435 family)
MKEHLLALGVFGLNSRLGDRIELLLKRDRIFSPRASLTRASASAAVLLVLTVIASLAPRWIAFAQRLEFEVASIKPHSGVAGYSGVEVSGPRVTATFMSVRDLIVYAYNLKPYQISGGAAWTTNERFDIQAKAAGDAAPSKVQIAEMFQGLLAGRFHLKFQRETRDLPALGLVVSRNGPKLKESTAAVSFTRFNARQSPVLEIAVTKGTLAELADQLSRYAFSFRIDGPTGRPVVDRTGLTGQYDFSLTWIPEDQTPPPGSDAASLSTALQEQLGLKLEPVNARMEIVVIEGVERPDAN